VAAFLRWLDQNWFILLQSLGIIGGLCLTSATVRRDARAREATNRLSLLEQHRELWKELHQRSDLFRVRRQDVDLVAQPISTVEREFLNLVIVHFHTGWLLSAAGSTNSPEAMATDVRTFFSLPIPRAVFEETKVLRDRAFVEFVESCFVLH
jgi:hypothetical protein